MAAALVSISEYPATTYRPDRDYSRLQVVTEQRMQVSPSRFRTPAICMILRSDTAELILRKPPFLGIEILSNDDTPCKMTEAAGAMLRTQDPEIAAPPAEILEID